MRASAKWGKAIGAAAVLLAAAGMSGCESGGDVQILDVAPRVGHTQGDQSVRILGKNFRQDIGYTVYFGKHKTSAVTILNPETLEVVTPSGVDPGQVDIMIRTDDGAAFKIAQVFKFEDMGGSVVEGLGNTPGAPKGEQKGNLAF
jgi:hypothetical protein